MLEQIHNHLLSELDRTSKGDTVFVVCAVLFDLMVLGVNSAVASGRPTSFIIFVIFMAGAVIVTVAALIALVNGRTTHTLYHSALMRLYEEHNVAQYYPEAAVGKGRLRVTLYIIVVLAAGFLATTIPLLVLRELRPAP